MDTGHKTLKWNYIFLDWYMQNDDVIMIKNENVVGTAFDLMSLAIDEDPYAFFRIFMHISNSYTIQKTKLYRTCIHFICTICPDHVMVNIERIIAIGSKDDILFYAPIPHMTKRIMAFVERMSKKYSGYTDLLNGKLTNEEVPIIIDEKKMSVKELLEKILDEPAFNHIQL